MKSITTINAQVNKNIEAVKELDLYFSECDWTYEGMDKKVKELVKKYGEEVKRGLLTKVDIVVSEQLFGQG